MFYKIMKLPKNFQPLIGLLLAFLFTSCLPQISVKAGNADDATIFFSTGFSSAVTKTLKNLSGLDSDASLFNKEDILLVLGECGAVNTSASLPSQNELAASGTLPSLSANKITNSGLLKKNKNSLTLTIGNRQIVDFYNLLSDEAKSYLDLMMIPALIGEKMTFDEYQELLASMYGPTFADEIVNGKLTIVLSSPDGKKQKKDTVRLGDLLTQTEDKIWSVTW
jgi:hypothetical protein